jgi:hypothetical protein
LCVPFRADPIDWSDRRTTGRSASHPAGGYLRLSADPAQEPPDKRTEYQPGLGRERKVGGHADKDAECQPDYRADHQKEPRSPSVLPGSDAHCKPSSPPEEVAVKDAKGMFN